MEFVGAQSGADLDDDGPGLPEEAGVKWRQRGGGWPATVWLVRAPDAETTLRPFLSGPPFNP